MDSITIPATRPLLRGYIHLVAAVITPYALVHLLLISDSPRDYVGASMFGASLILVYATSAAYHVVPWTPRIRAVVRRVDHSMIFFFIGGSYTPFALKLLGNGWGIPILSVVWSLAGIGIMLKILAPQAPRWLGVGIYLSLGWIGLVPIVQIAEPLPLEALAIVVAGGLLYSTGSLIYLKRWPNPFPRVFGFHEVFHTMVVLASAAMYFVVGAYVLTI